MKALLILLSTGLACLTGAQAVPGPFKVLVIQGVSGDHSPTSNAAKPVLTAMAAANNFTIDFSSDHAQLNDATLAKYQVFVQMNLYPFDLTNPERAALQKFVESGKGWVGIHASGCANTAWPWYSKFLGDLTWVKHDELRNGTLLFEDRDHPISKAMPASLVIKDEWYQFSKSPRANVRVLAKADEHNYAPYNANGDHPIVWVLPGTAHAVYISIGHDPADWQVANYVTMVREAILWANPASTTGIGGIGGSQATLGSPVAGRAWIRDGILNLDPALSEGAGGRIKVSDAGGRNLTLVAEGASRFRILGANRGGRYFLSEAAQASTAQVQAMPIQVR